MVTHFRQNKGEEVQGKLWKGAIYRFLQHAQETVTVATVEGDMASNTV